MNEAQTRKDLIDPAIEKAGWTKANGKEIYEMDLQTGGVTPVKAFASPQKIWKLMRTKWNLEGAKTDGVKGTRSPRILYS